MRAGQSLSQLTSRLLIGLENHFAAALPQLVLAHGDTTTCFATAVSSFYHKVPFFHVEAGLRTFRLSSPFPEEFNRQAIAPIAQHHFAPTDLERENLIRDGVPAPLITVTGSTVHEAVRKMMSNGQTRVSPGLPEVSDQRPLVIVTLHRRESAQSLQHTLAGVKDVAAGRPDALFICPVHPSPPVQDAFRTSLQGLRNVFLTAPLDYSQFVSLLLRCQVIVTDSGGVQEEAAFLGKRVLLARSETERADGIESGLVTMVGASADSLRKALFYALNARPPVCQSPATPSASPSELIANEVLRFVG